MTVTNIDEFYGDLKDKLREAYRVGTKNIRISIAGEAALRRLSNVSDMNLGEEENTHRNIEISELAEMLEIVKDRLPELRREHVKVSTSNGRLPVNWGNRTFTKRQGGLRLVVSN